MFCRIEDSEAGQTETFQVCVRLGACVQEKEFHHTLAVAHRYGACDMSGRLCAQ